MVLALKPMTLRCAFCPGMLLHTTKTGYTNGFLLEEWMLGRSKGSLRSDRIRPAAYVLLVPDSVSG